MEAEPIISAANHQGDPGRAPIRIAVRIQSLLDQLGKTAGWLADTVGLQRSTIMRILRGDRNPTAETLAEIAPVLGVTLAELVAGTDAAERVKAASELVSRETYRHLLQGYLEYESRVNELSARVRDLIASNDHEHARSQRARIDLEASQQRFSAMIAERDEAIRQRDYARREADQDASDVRMYRAGLAKAVADVAALREQVRELEAKVSKSNVLTAVSATCAAAAAAVTIASYLTRDAPTACDSDVSTDRDNDSKKGS